MSTTDRPVIAHLLRRTGFGPFPGQVEAVAAAGDVDAAITSVLGASPPALGSPPILVTGDTGDYPEQWWLRRMRMPEVGLHEKMTWFWHGHLTTSLDKVSPTMMWNQHLLVRQHALGNFRELLQAITVDPGMLVYLDGAWSNATDPNENYAREVMELFALGRLQYTEDDVRAGAKALAGYGVDWNSATATLYSWGALSSPVTYLGRSVQTASDVIDAICDHAACPGWVAGRIYRQLVGVDPTNSRRTQLATLFRSNNLEIAPLVESILRGPEFLTARMNRPRVPVEFLTAALAAGLKNDVDYTRWESVDMGQQPFHPPNVAGWPVGASWLSPSLAIVRADVANNLNSVAAIVQSTNPVGMALRQCSLYEVTAETRNAMSVAAGKIANPEDRARTLLALAISSPEFALA